MTETRSLTLYCYPAVPQLTITVIFFGFC